MPRESSQRSSSRTGIGRRRPQRTTRSSPLFSGLAAEWLTRLLSERGHLGLGAINLTVTLLARLDRIDARRELAALLSARFGIEARAALDLPSPPARHVRESFVDYMHRMKREGHADEMAAFERARSRFLIAPL